MHIIGDEQWCGGTPDPNQVVINPHPTQLRGWIYYCGRVGSSSGGGLQFISLFDETCIVRSAALKPKPSGDVVGLAIDLDKCQLAFDLNGVFQGADTIPKQPMWILTTVGTARDKI